MVGTLLLVAVATAFNAGVIIHKLRKERYTDSLVDISANLIMTTLYAGTLGGMAISMVASLIFSIYLWFFPVKLPTINYTPAMKWLVRVFVALLVITLLVIANAYGLLAFNLLLS